MANEEANDIADLQRVTGANLYALAFLLTRISRLARLSLSAKRNAVSTLPAGVYTERFSACDDRPHTSPTRDMAFNQRQELPVILEDESFDDVVHKLYLYLTQHVSGPYTFAAMEKAPEMLGLSTLVKALVTDCHHPAVVSALL
nr:hypothetical protein CFP56_72099 [Quercus suber]